MRIGCMIGRMWGIGFTYGIHPATLRRIQDIMVKVALEPEFKYYSGNPPPPPTFTDPPVPPATSTPTLTLPSITPTQRSTSTPTPTPLPPDTQLSIFEDLWSIVNATYVYPDFNGLYLK